MYKTYNGRLSAELENYNKFNIEYGKAYSEIENNDSYILDIEGEIKEAIANFEEFCQGLLKE